MDYENTVMRFMLKQFGIWNINLIMACKKKAVLHVVSTAFDMVYQFT